MSTNKKFIGRYLLYPDTTNNRASEGGLRTQEAPKNAETNSSLVTVITVCLNSAKTIEQCIQSVRRQTYTNIEYIVIDGGSSDATRQQCENKGVKVVPKGV